MKVSLLLVVLAISELLIVESYCYKITVETWKKKTATLDVKGTDRISSLKPKLEKKFGIPIEELRITANSELLDDNQTLDDYPDVAGFLWLANPLTKQLGGVYARAPQAPKQKIVYMMMNATDTLGQIVKAIEDVSGIDEKKMRLFFQNKEMTDKSKTAADYKLFQEAWIDVKEKL